MIYSNSNEKQFWICLQIPWNTPSIPLIYHCVMMQSLNQPTLSVLSSGMLTADWSCSSHYLLHFPVFKSLKFFSELGPCNTKLSPFQLLPSSKFCCTCLKFMWEQMQMSSSRVAQQVFLQIFLHLIPLIKFTR